MEKLLPVVKIIQACIKLEKDSYKDQARVIWNEVIYPHIKNNKEIFFEVKDIDEYYNGPHISPGAQYSYKEIVSLYEDIVHLINN